MAAAHSCWALTSASRPLPEMVRRAQPGKVQEGRLQDSRDGHWRLTIGEKKRILTTHIFGVDIDAQAVEVTKLSLLLKVLEGENNQSVSQQQRLFHDRALPNLADNIKCGNSLIGPDYFTGKLISDPDEMKRVNPFDWKRGFPDAVNAGGFDCVIGNPPWSMAGYYIGSEIEYMENSETAKEIRSLLSFHRERVGVLPGRRSLRDDRAQ